MPRVFKRIEEKGLTVKPSKIDIWFPEVSFLGHIIKHGYVVIDDVTVSYILKIGILRALISLSQFNDADS